MGGTRPRYAQHSGAVFSLKYHVVWCPKYRREVLVPPVDTRLKTIIGTVAAEYGFTVHAMEVMPDHVHLFIAADPTRSVAEIVNRFRGEPAASCAMNSNRCGPVCRLCGPELFRGNGRCRVRGRDQALYRSAEGRLNADALLQVQDRAEQDAGGGPFGHA